TLGSVLVTLVSGHLECGTTGLSRNCGAAGQAEGGKERIGTHYALRLCRCRKLRRPVYCTDVPFLPQPAQGALRGAAGECRGVSFGIPDILPAQHYEITSAASLFTS
ncbi:hypothetical protein BCV70DRAFT_202620, partial [Testicularia cyperi]